MTFRSLIPLLVTLFTGCGGAPFEMGPLLNDAGAGTSVVVPDDAGLGAADAAAPLGQVTPDAATVDRDSAAPPPPPAIEAGAPSADVEAGALPATCTIAPGACGTRAVCVSGVCAPALRVFVTYMAYAATFGGAAGADGACQARALTAKLGGTWKAWVSDSQTSPAVRFTQSTTLSYRLLNGAPVAASWTNLTTSGGLLLHDIDMYEDGTSIPSNAALEVWTNTEPTGYASSVQACHDFTSTDGNGNPKVVVGITDRMDPGKWSNDGTYGCDRTDGHFYCFEQDAP